MNRANENALLIRMWMAGDPVDQIAEATGLTKGAVLSRSSRLDMPARKGVEDTTVIRKDLLLQRLREVHPLMGRRSPRMPGFKPGTRNEIDAMRHARVLVRLNGGDRTKKLPGCAWGCRIRKPNCLCGQEDIIDE